MRFLHPVFFVRVVEVSGHDSSGERERERGNERKSESGRVSEREIEREARWRERDSVYVQTYADVC